MLKRRWTWLLSVSVLSLGSSAPAYAGLLDATNQIAPRFVTLPPRGVNQATLEAQAAASLTVPFFASTVRSPLDGKDIFISDGRNEPRYIKGKHHGEVCTDLAAHSLGGRHGSGPDETRVRRQLKRVPPLLRVSLV